MNKNKDKHTQQSLLRSHFKKRKKKYILCDKYALSFSELKEKEKELNMLHTDERFEIELIL